MSVKFNRITGIIIVSLLVLCGFSIRNHTHDLYILGKTKAVGTELIKKNKYKNHHTHRPVLTKTVPSAYKKLINSGKSVSKAVQIVMQQTNGSRKKPNKNNRQYEQAITTLKSDIDGSSENWHIQSAWSPFPNDKVELMPGESTANGQYDCAFLIYNPKKNRQIDGVYLAKYNANNQQFSDVDNYGTRQYNKDKISPKLKKNLKLNLIKKNHKKPQKRNARGGAAHVK